MQVPLVDLKKQYSRIGDEVSEAIARVCDSQQFILGENVARLEEEVARYTGSPLAVGVSSGTDALMVSLMALGIGPGDEVITTSYTFFSTVGSIVRLGARPVLVDIEPQTYNINPLGIEGAVTERTRAILPVHLYGHPADMAGITKVAEAFGIPVVEDAAQSFGSMDNSSRKAGTIGTMGCLSFFPSKILGAYGDAGMVLTGSPELARKVRVLRTHGEDPKYHHAVVGGNFRLDEIQAAILRVKLGYVDDWIRERRRVAENYDRLFSQAGLSGEVSLPTEIPGYFHSFNLYVIRVRERDALKKYLREKGVGCGVYYPLPLHLHRCFSHLEYREGDFPEAESAAREALALPMFPELAPDQQGYVVECVRQFYRG